MSFCKVLSLGALLFFAGAVSAEAQVGVYASFSGEHIGGITCPSFASPCGSSEGVARPYGENFGAYYDFRNLGPVRIGADVRGGLLRTNKRADSSAGGAGIVRQYDALGGLRGSFKTPISWLHPYAEIAGGFARNNTSGKYTLTTTVNNTVNPSTTTTALSYDPATYTNYTVVKGFVGLDITLLPYLDLRAFELGIGEAFGSAPTLISVTNTISASGTSTVSALTSTSPNTHSVQSIGAGVVFHFPR